MANQSSTNQIFRPIAGFHPCHWGDHFLNLTHHDEEILIEKEQEIYQLKVEVGKLLAAAKEPQEQLTFIDTLERLGVSYHFEKEIEQALELAYESFHGHCENADLNHVSLRFRIFRQHGFYVPCDVFNKFKDENGRFKESLISDVQGMLSLYEASHVRVDDDKILDEALVFTTAHLTALASNLSSPLAEQVTHALHQPLHLGMPRVEARFYISIYEKDPSHNDLVLQFAKLDFNFLQSLHQRELKDLKTWWKGLHLKASFSRDRITEAYFWTLGVFFEPQFSFAREVFRKVFKSTSLLDDTYDAYGTLEELKIVTEAFQRPWNKDVVEELPEHVKWCYYAYVTTCDEAEEDLAKEGRAFCVDYLRQQVKTLSKAYMKEAEWCHQKYVPTYEEYMENAIITSPYPIGIVMSFLGMGEIASKEYFEWANQNPIPDVIKAVSTILRLMNDMGGHEFEQSRNHVASSVQCLMEHNKVTENEAKEMLSKEVEDAWKVVNKAMLKPYVIPKPLLTRILNLARSAHVIYHGTADGYTNVNQILKDKIGSVLVNPISM
ncbi:(-)-drimenol synthase-like [Silene latifolia]|uniref:(-)-drimenol synthase-like n=1 Tax=Silene latifolia TaxID=37657 RepID=UPI003D77B5DE